MERRKTLVDTQHVVGQLSVCLLVSTGRIDGRSSSEPGAIRNWPVLWSPYQEKKRLHRPISHPDNDKHLHSWYNPKNSSSAHPDMSSTPNKLARSRLLPGWFGKKTNRVHEAVRPGSTNSGDVQMAESIRPTTVVLQWLSDPREVLVVDVAETNPVRCVCMYTRQLGSARRRGW